MDVRMQGIQQGLKEPWFPRGRDATLTMALQAIISEPNNSRLPRRSSCPAWYETPRASISSSEANAHASWEIPIWPPPRFHSKMRPPTPPMQEMHQAGGRPGPASLESGATTDKRRCRRRIRDDLAVTAGCGRIIERRARWSG